MGAKNGDITLSLKDALLQVQSYTRRLHVFTVKLMVKNDAFLMMKNTNLFISSDHKKVPVYKLDSKSGVS